MLIRTGNNNAFSVIIFETIRQQIACNLLPDLNKLIYPNAGFLKATIYIVLISTLHFATL